MAGVPDKRSESGQAAVEFALITPLLVVLLLAVIQVGVAFHDYVTLTDAARAGARKAIVARFSGANLTASAQAVRDAASDLDQSKLGVTVADPTWNSPGSVVTVTATYPYSINIPLLGVTVMSGNLTATSKERLE
jgi:Flp pilus assembly protein TadG